MHGTVNINKFCTRILHGTQHGTRANKSCKIRSRRSDIKKRQICIRKKTIQEKKININFLVHVLLKQNQNVNKILKRIKTRKINKASKQTNKPSQKKNKQNDRLDHNQLPTSKVSSIPSFRNETQKRFLIWRNPIYN